MILRKIATAQLWKNEYHLENISWNTCNTYIHKCVDFTEFLRKNGESKFSHCVIGGNVIFYRKYVRYSHSQWLFYEFVSKITNRLVKQSLRVTVHVSHVSKKVLFIGKIFRENDLKKWSLCTMHTVLAINKFFRQTKGISAHFCSILLCKNASFEKK